MTAHPEALSGPSSLARLFVALQPELKRALRAFPADVRDEALSHAWEQLCRKPTAWIEEAHVCAWLFVVARHAAWAEQRQRELPLALPDGTSIDVPTREVPVADMVDLRDGLSRLKRQQRVALTCRLLGLSYEQAMTATGRTYTWINKHTVEGRAALRASAA